MQRLPKLITFASLNLTMGSLCFGESHATRPSDIEAHTLGANYLELLSQRPDLATFGLIGAVALAGIALMRRGGSRDNA